LFNLVQLGELRLARGSGNEPVIRVFSVQDLVSGTNDLDTGV